MDDAAVQRAKREIQVIVQQIAELSRSDVSPDQYYEEFLNKVVSALAAVGGAVWTVSATGQLQLGYQINLRAGIRTDNYRIEAFVTNLTDDETPTAINRFRDLSFDTSLFDFSTLGYQLGLRDRRQVGIRATYEF